MNKTSYTLLIRIPGIGKENCSGKKVWEATFTSTQKDRYGLQPRKIFYHNEQKVKRVNKGLPNHLDLQQRRKLYCTFLSELLECYDALLQTMIKIFSRQPNALDNYGDTTALFISQTAKSVEHEKHRMKAFIRFEKANEELFFVVAEPNFNVLPLGVDFFKNQPIVAYLQCQKKIWLAL